MAILFVFSGLPGVGKTTLARALAPRLQAVHLRVDSVEAALKTSVLAISPAEDAGYVAAAAVAMDNLRLGNNVIADAVNPIEITRNIWLEAALGAKVKAMHIEVVCPNEFEHQRRVESRHNDISAMCPPTWNDVKRRKFEPWKKHRLVVDTFQKPIQDNVEDILESFSQLVRYGSY
ncbi:Chromatin associated protein KTI12 [Pseudovibrio axinellae]|uniref:Chromatin associated protein KTI12 n=1 Tax=Pseudovibrio axinellae TaxID=989403 RepID=A0A165UNE5_9HYPH|nr:AAA family ATPase [Pseudovibrio axinellae]KZL12604.1 Chromatin associated protein KTI12 [Pseudovibrio axinellae]SEP64851.1 Predicted kinase [Pseudovibrio axinellae]